MLLLAASYSAVAQQYTNKELAGRWHLYKIMIEGETMAYADDSFATYKALLKHAKSESDFFEANDSVVFTNMFKELYGNIRICYTDFTNDGKIVMAILPFGMSGVGKLEPKEGTYRIENGNRMVAIINGEKPEEAKLLRNNKNLVLSIAEDRIRLEWRR